MDELKRKYFSPEIEIISILQDSNISADPVAGSVKDDGLTPEDEWGEGLDF